MSETREERWVVKSHQRRVERYEDDSTMREISDGGIAFAVPKRFADYLNALEQERDELRALVVQTIDELGKCSLYTDRGDAIFGAFRQTRCHTHDKVAKDGMCPVGAIRARYDSLIQEGK